MENDKWYVCLVMDVIQDVHRAKPFMAMLGLYGYVKRNNHNQQYYQLVATATDGYQRSFYVKEKDALPGLDVTNEAEYDIDPLWSHYFKMLKW